MRIAEDDPHEESVELSLRKGIGTLMFERILRGKYDKWRRQIERGIPDGDTFFFHGLEESGLYLGWSTIDLVGEEDMSEYRSTAYLELALLGSVDLIARQIRREEIRSERYPTRIESEHRCKCPDCPSLTKTRDSLEESMATGEECDNQLLDEGILPDDLLLDISLDLYECIVDMSESWIHR